MTSKIFYSLPWDKYVALERLNPSTIVHGMNSMAHLKAALDEPDDGNKKPAMAMGIVTASIALEDAVDDRLVVWPHDTRTKKGFKAFKQEHDGKIILTTPEFNRVLRMAAAVRSNKEAMAWLEGSAREVTVTSELHGVPLKGRIDSLKKTLLADLKTTGCAAHEEFGRTAARLHYDMKMGCYAKWADAWNACYIVVENKPPFCCVVYDIPIPNLELGWSKAADIIKRYAECRESGVWPGPENGTLFTPNWSMPEGDSPSFAIRR